MEWPCYRILALACSLTSFGVAVYMYGSKFPSASTIGWLVLRPMFGCGSFICCILAVHADTPFGDVASLGSINIVAAALLGRMFLKEDILLIHSLALLFATLGAILISKPTFIFHRSTDTGGSWLGYVLALVSGFLDALSFICSRKSAAIPAGFIMLGTQVISAIALFTMGSVPWIFEDYSIAILTESPWKTSFIVGVACALAILCTAACVVGSVLCPAAVSTTVYTSANMTSGYLAQLFLYNVRPSPLTLTGASLMLASVVTMVCSRQPAKLTGDTLDCSEACSDSTPKEINDDESIASFMASEFAVSNPHDGSTRKRQLQVAQALPSEAQPDEAMPTIIGI